MGAETLSIPLMTVLLWSAIVFLSYRVLRRILLIPMARLWRERPVVMWDDHEQRWRAAERRHVR